MEKELIGEILRRFIHPAVIKVLSLRRKFKLEIQGSIPKGQQFIFIANHFCIDDIPTLGEIIGDHIYVLVSDEDKGTPDGLALDLNGVVWTNRLDKDVRKKSRDGLLRHLRLGHSIVMYPEATWNLSPNLPMLPMNFGCISLSLETGVPILPIYLHFTDDVCYVDINNPFYPSENKVESIGELRDIMATSAWKYFELDERFHRKTLNLNYWEENIAERYSNYGRAQKDPAGVRAYEAQFIFRPKGHATYEEAFAHLDQLIPCRENAFLFRNR